MGTKSEPSRFDCHAAAGPDEPLFTLLARDPLAPFLVSIWGSVRRGDLMAASKKFTRMIDALGLHYISEPDADKASEALECALAMFTWAR